MNKVDLKGRHFLKLLDYTPEEISYLLDLAADYKAKKKAGVLVDTLKGKGHALEWMFEKIFAMETEFDGICVFEIENRTFSIAYFYFVDIVPDLCMLNVFFRVVFCGKRNISSRLSVIGQKIPIDFGITRAGSTSNDLHRSACNMTIGSSINMCESNVFGGDKCF